jgi:hypothetical protein
LVKRITATGVVSGSPGVMRGFYVSSTTAGTLVMRDGGASDAQLTGTITPAVGWHEFPAPLKQGLHVTVGGTIDVTFHYET